MKQMVKKKKGHLIDNYGLLYQPKRHFDNGDLRNGIPLSLVKVFNQPSLHNKWNSFFVFC